MEKKMELILESHSAWYGEKIKEFHKNSVWNLLNDEITITELKEKVNNSLKTGKGFNIKLNFKTGLGKSQAWLIMQEMTDIE